MTAQKRFRTRGVAAEVEKGWRTGVVVGLALLFSSCAPALARASTPPEQGAGEDGPVRAHSPQEATREKGTIQVTGQASLSVPADQALITFAVETEGSSAGEATAENARRMDAVISALRGGLDTGLSLETFGYSLRPEYEVPRESPGTRSISGYRVQNHIRVTLQTIDDTGRVLDLAVEAGANRVANLQFQASDTREARLEALRQAATQAREEARAIAAAMGVELGAVLEVQGGSSAPGPRSFEGLMVRAAAEASTPIEGGDQRVTANVTITFEIVEGGS